MNIQPRLTSGAPPAGKPTAAAESDLPADVVQWLEDKLTPDEDASRMRHLFAVCRCGVAERSLSMERDHLDRARRLVEVLENPKLFPPDMTMLDREELVSALLSAAPNCGLGDPQGKDPLLQDLPKLWDPQPYAGVVLISTHEHLPGESILRGDRGDSYLRVPPLPLERQQVLHAADSSRLYLRLLGFVQNPQLRRSTHSNSSRDPERPDCDAMDAVAYAKRYVDATERGAYEQFLQVCGQPGTSLVLVKQLRELRPDLQEWARSHVIETWRSQARDGFLDIPWKSQAHDFLSAASLLAAGEPVAAIDDYRRMLQNLQQAGISPQVARRIGGLLGKHREVLLRGFPERMDATLARNCLLDSWQRAALGIRESLGDLGKPGVSGSEMIYAHCRGLVSACRHGCTLEEAVGRSQRFLKALPLEKFDDDEYSDRLLVLQALAHGIAASAGNQVLAQLLIELRFNREMDADEVTRMVSAAARMQRPDDGVPSLVSRLEESAFLTGDYNGVYRAQRARGPHISEAELLEQMQHQRALGTRPQDCAKAAIARLSRVSEAVSPAEVRREGGRLLLGRVAVPLSPMQKNGGVG